MILRNIVITVCLVLFLAPHFTAAQEVPELSAKRISKLTRDGDRLADQGDYLAALKKYTKAYMGVVSDIRGQKFTTEVKPKMFSREDLAKEMREQIDQEYTEEELLLMDSSYKVLGLMKPTTDGKQLMTKMLTEEVAGFYDPDNKRMVLIVEDTGDAKEPGWLDQLLGARPAFDKDEQKTTLAHELTHALQDQLYDLNAMQSGIEDDDDMSLAFSALVEGDATLLMFLESGDGMDIDDMDPEAMRSTFSMMSWMMPMAGGSSFRQAPPIFRDSLIFPYMQGMIFSLSVAGQNGWASVHSAYQHPPLSTEQILHPRKYLDKANYDAPQSVEIPELKALETEGWKHLGGNCLGELQTTIMLKPVLGGSRAAAGWDGDRYEVFLRGDNNLAAVMVSVWDSEDDAKDFENTYLKMRAKNPFDSSAVFEEGAERLVAREGDKVYIVEGLETKLADSIMAELKKSKFEEKSFPLPAKVEQTAEEDN